MKKMAGIVVAAVCLLLAVPESVVQTALAQSPTAGPPPMLVIYREEIKAGHRGPYSQSASNWPAVLRQAKHPGHYVALTSVSGPNEAWFLEGVSSFAEIGARDKMVEDSADLRAKLDALSAADGEHLSMARTMHATYRADLSYGAPVDLAKVRYFTVVTTRVRPGHGPAFADMLRKSKAAHEKAGMSETYAVYQVVTGAPAGTFLMFIPVTSLQRVDELGEEHATKYQAALTDEDRELQRKVGTDSVMWSETNHFAINPRLSYVSDELIARDPSFWAPRAKAAAKD